MPEPLMWGQIFGNEHPISMELCSGNGSWVAERAHRFPDQNWVAVERRGDRVGKIVSRRRRESLHNLFVVHGDARSFVAFYLPRGSVSEVFINFPDPWPKLRHAKHRLVQAPFLQALSLGVQRGARLMLVTDERRYAGQMVHELAKVSQWQPLLLSPFYATAWEGYGESFFSSLFMKQGVALHYLSYHQVLSHAT